MNLGFVWDLVFGAWDFHLSQEDGYAAITATLIVLASSLIILAGFSFFTFQEVNINRTYAKSIAAQAAAEGGEEDAIYRIINGKQIASSETLGVGTAMTTITVTTDGSTRIIRSEGEQGSFERSVEVKLSKDTTGASFVYGVQIGAGGLSMQNTTQVSGSIYSNGNITGSNSPVITGDAIAAGISQISGLTINGNAQAHNILDSTISGYASSTIKIENTTVGLDAHANELKQSTINRDAYYMIIDPQTTVAGQKFPGTPPPGDAATLAMPISDAVLDQWEQDAALGGTISSPCPYKPANGSVIGPVKVLCDVVIDGTTEVTLGGPLWVVGNFEMKNNAILRLSSSFGSDSSVVIADDPADRSTKSTVIIQNSAQILGSGVASSYIMVVSRNNSMESGGGNAAIDVKNTSAASIYYAPHGKLKINNSTNLKEATAYGIEMANSAVLTYESGLSEVNFSSGPSGGFNVRYWKEVE